MLHKVSLVANTVGWFVKVWIKSCVALEVLLGLKGFELCCFSWLSFWIISLGAVMVCVEIGHLCVGNHCSRMPSILMGNLALRKNI